MGPFFKVNLSGIALQDLIDCVHECISNSNDFHRTKELKSLYNTLRNQLEKEGLLFIVEDEE